MKSPDGHEGRALYPWPAGSKRIAERKIANPHKRLCKTWAIGNMTPEIISQKYEIDWLDSDDLEERDILDELLYEA
jgi:hypothetical protein